MPNESLITRIENLLAEIIELGGQNEDSKTVPNLTVQNANPSDASGFIIVSDDRDGDNIVAKKVGSVIYSDNDKVNVMFVKGGEAIAFQQGSESLTTGDIWEIVPSTSTDIFYDRGQVGIETTAPKLLLQVGADGGDSPVNAAIEGIFVANATSAQVAVRDTGDNVETVLVSSSGGFVGTSTNHSLGLLINNTTRAILTTGGDFGVGTITPDAKIESFATSGAQLRLSFQESLKYVDFTVNTTHDLTITPTSTGQIILQPTIDSTDFAQVRNAASSVVWDVDTVNGRVGVGTASPSDLLEVEKASGNLNVKFETLGANSNCNLLLTNDAQEWLLGVRGTTSDAFTIRDNTGGVFYVTVTTSGDVGIGDDLTSPNAKLHVDQPSTTAAQPVLYLKQADVDEPFEKYVGTAAAANLTRSIVDNGDVTTATLVGWRKIEIEDLGNQVTDQDYYEPFYTLA